MPKKALIGIGLVVLLTVIAAACAPQASPATSLPVEAVPAETEQVEVVSEEAPSTEPTEVMVEEEAEHTEEMSEESSDGRIESDPEAMDETATTGVVAFEIVQAESEVRFTLDELLRGNPKTVIGATDQVSGDIQVDFENPANSQVGVVQINAGTLATDSSFRNQAIQKFILETGQYEYITFTPTSIAGLPESVSLGEAITFTITGDLTIRDITNKVTFETTVTAVSETRFDGYASTTIARADYNLTIPEVQQVANVDEEVLLEIEFVAAPPKN